MIQEKDNPFQKIFESAVEGVIVSDLKGKILIANRAAEKLFGYRKHELKGLLINDLIPKDIRNLHEKLRKGYIKNPEPRKMGIGLDLVALKKNNQIIPVEISLSFSTMANSRIIIAFIIDITERKKFQEKVRIEKETAQMYLDVAGSIFLVIDLKGRIRLVNQAGCALLGFTESEILGKSFLSHVPRGRKSKMRENFGKMIQLKNRIYEFEEFILNNENERKIVAWTVTLINDDEGKPVSMLCSGIDITDRKNAELALKASEQKLIVYATELEKRVSERTRELAEAIQNLEKANNELQEEIKTRMKAEEDARKAFQKEKELSEMKSRFVSLASHEFRTPLSTIMSSVSLIGRYNNPELRNKRMKHIKRIKNNIKNLTSLLDDFLNLEQLEEGRIQAVYNSFNFKEFINEIGDEMQAIAKKGQAINLIAKNNVEEVILDKQMLKNICFNLLSNAIKYSNEDSTITFIYSRQKNSLKLKVIDEGIGIPKSEQHNLFLRFFRAKNASGIQGTGLGLYIVKKYVEEMNGSINFTSHIESGTTFVIQLPLNHDKDTTH